MESNKKIGQAKIPSRRKFVLGLSAFTIMASITSALRFPFSSLKNISAGKSIKGKTITMLTRDGKLVQVDEALIPSRKRKVNNNELLNWIKK